MINKVVDPNIAISAYTNSSSIGTKGISGDDGVSFSDYLEKSVESSIKTLKAGEQMAAKGVMGTADPTDVVQAVNSADMTLQTVVASRDKMIGAYQDILRMPI
jgi:flagellar hook-basal body complex protein FliE